MKGGYRRWNKTRGGKGRKRENLGKSARLTARALRAVSRAFRQRKHDEEGEGERTGDGALKKVGPVDYLEMSSFLTCSQG